MVVPIMALLAITLSSLGMSLTSYTAILHAESIIKREIDLQEIVYRCQVERGKRFTLNKSYLNTKPEPRTYITVQKSQ